MAGILKSTCCGSNECPDNACSDCSDLCSSSSNCYQHITFTAPALPYSRATYLQPTSQNDWRPTTSYTISGQEGWGLKRYHYDFRQKSLDEVSCTDRCCCNAAWAASGINRYEGLNAGGNYANPVTCGSVRFYEYQYTTYNIFTGAPTVQGGWSDSPQVFVSGADNCGGVAQVNNRTNNNGSWPYQSSYPDYMNGSLAVKFT